MGAGWVSAGMGEYGWVLPGESVDNLGRIIHAWGVVWVLVAVDDLGRDIHGGGGG
jgi:hypothetical protein